MFDVGLGTKLRKLFTGAGGKTSVLQSNPVHVKPFGAKSQDVRDVFLVKLQASCIL